VPFTSVSKMSFMIPSSKYAAEGHYYNQKEVSKTINSSKYLQWRSKLSESSRENLDTVNACVLDKNAYNSSVTDDFVAYVVSALVYTLSLYLGMHYFLFLWSFEIIFLYPYGTSVGMYSRGIKAVWADDRQDLTVLWMLLRGIVSTTPVYSLSFLISTSQRKGYFDYLFGIDTVQQNYATRNEAQKHYDIVSVSVIIVVISIWVFLFYYMAIMYYDCRCDRVITTTEDRKNLAYNAYSFFFKNEKSLTHLSPIYCKYFCTRARSFNFGQFNLTNYFLYKNPKNFDEACKMMKNFTTTPSHNDGMQLYGLFKQATLGDCNQSKPGIMSTAHALKKWEAWNSRKGLSPENAKKEYVALVGKYLQ